MTHSLQTASRAFRDGRDEEYVVCALIHDIGDVLGPSHHADIGAEILKPFISEQNHWMMQHHAIFQGYYYFHYLGGDRNPARRSSRATWPTNTPPSFCHLYDQNSFVPAYETMPPLGVRADGVHRICATTLKRTLFAPAKASA